MKNPVETYSATQNDAISPPSRLPYPTPGLLLCALAFVSCILVSIAPLNRLAGTSELLALPLNVWLTAIGTWLPTNLALTGDLHASQMSTHILLFMLLVALEFMFYGLGAWWVQRQTQANNQRRIMWVIWLTAFIAGNIFVLTPSLISHDAYVYAGYGRVFTTYHANPYFVTLSTYPQDPLNRLDDWKNAPAAYGPLWLMVSALGTLIAGDQPLLYVLLYRSLGLVAHLLNILLVKAILRKMGRAHHTVMLGTLLYAWNPLALQESCLGGHMDVSMLTLILLGIFFCARAEYAKHPYLTTLQGYLPALLAFVLATLIKFTAAPLIAFFLVFLARKTLQPHSLHTFRSLQWCKALQTLLPAGIICIGTLFAFYTPFWLGHPLPEILRSFTSPPSANMAYGSILDALQKWVIAYGLPAEGWAHTLLHTFSLYITWQIINILTSLAVAIIGCICIWRIPTIQMTLLATLILLLAILLVTPWFFPWYVLWIVGLAAICLPVHHSRWGRAGVAATFVFSASAHCIYLFARGYPPIGPWIGLTAFTTVGPPLLTLLAFLLWPLQQAEKPAPV